MTSDERIRLIFEIGGQDAIRAASEAFQRQIETIGELKASFERGEIGIQEYSDRLKSTTEAAMKTNAELNRLETAAARAGVGVEGAAAASAKGMNEAAAAATRARYDMLRWANVVDDLQYMSTMGIRPIINNVMQISPAAGIALIALDQIWRHWDELTGGVKAYEDSLEGLKSKLEDLTKKEHKITIDYHAIDEAKKEVQEIERGLNVVKSFGETRTEAEQARGRVVSEAVKEGGKGDALLRAIAAVERANGTDRKDDRIAQAEALEADAALDTAEAERLEKKNGPEAALFKRGQIETHIRQAAELRALAEQAKRARIGLLIDKAMKGDEGAVATIAEMYDKNQQVFTNSGLTDVFGAGIMTADQQGPENARHVKRQEERAKEAKKAKAEADAAAKAAEQSNVQHEEENEAHFDKARADNRAKVSAQFQADRDAEHAKEHAEHVKEQARLKAEHLARQAETKHEQEVSRQAAKLGAGDFAQTAAFVENNAFDPQAIQRAARIAATELNRRSGGAEGSMKALQAELEKERQKFLELTSMVQNLAGEARLRQQGMINELTRRMWALKDVLNEERRMAVRGPNARPGI